MNALIGIAITVLVSCIGSLYLMLFNLSQQVSATASTMEQISNNQIEFRAFMKEPRFTEKHFHNYILPLQKDVELLVKRQEEFAEIIERIHADGVETRIKVTRLESRLGGG